MSLQEYFENPFSSYGREQAIEDGYLIEVSELYPRDTRIFKYPVAITNEIWELIEGENAGAWIWDICCMCTMYIIDKPNESTVRSRCNLPAAPGSKQGKAYDLMAICHPGDNMEPVITIKIIT
jgi:hypothetical protein